ncbi:hypothetical protein BDN67DRAFT_965090 [Paxillus ammoniavirescens]|nr:hypothetical protein BDN67DRAFT_965090 [Paxillus ammoniavirescens]
MTGISSCSPYPSYPLMTTRLWRSLGLSEEKRSSLWLASILLCSIFVFPAAGYSNIYAI